MNRLRAAAALTLLPVLAGGCVAAAIPVVAGGLMARDQLQDSDKRESAKPEAATPAPVMPKTQTGQVAVTAVEGRVILQSGMTALPPPNGAAGAGEAAAYSLQAYQALWNHLTAQAERRHGASGSAAFSALSSRSKTTASGLPSQLA